MAMTPRSDSTPDDVDRPSEGTVVLVPGRRADCETTGEIEANTMVAVPERVLRLSERDAGATRPEGPERSTARHGKTTGRGRTKTAPRSSTGTSRTPILSPLPRAGTPSWTDQP